MPTKKKLPEERVKTGRPTLYKPEYCSLLVNHLKNGGTMESFGSNIPCSAQTVYTWVETHPEFLEAKKEGESMRHAYYENMGKMIASGNLRRLKSEVPVIVDGKPIYDAEGNVIYKREYEAATPGQSTFIFMTKNMLGWKDRKDVELTGKDGGPVAFANLGKEDLDKAIEDLIGRAKKKD